MQMLKVAEIDRVEDVRLDLSGSDQMHVVVNAAATDAYPLTADHFSDFALARVSFAGLGSPNLS